MSGHSRWSQIKHKKAITDAKRSQAFSKLSKVISMAARKGEDPDANFELRAAIDKAKAANMPANNIEKAIKKGSGSGDGAQLESVRYEAYLPCRQAGGPGGVAIIIEAITDNKNRTVAEIKHLLSKVNCTFAESGAATWAFSPTEDGGWEPQHKIELSEQDAEKLDKALEALDDHDDVQDLYTNAE